MITTNVNDYAIQPNGLHGLDADKKHNIQVQEVPLKFKEANMTIPSKSLSPGHPLRYDEFERSHAGDASSSSSSSSSFRSPTLPKTTPPRRLESELALIVDKEFQEKYVEDFPDQPNQEDLILFLADTINWMQMW